MMKAFNNVETKKKKKKNRSFLVPKDFGTFHRVATVASGGSFARAVRTRGSWQNDIE